MSLNSGPQGSMLANHFRDTSGRYYKRHYMISESVEKTEIINTVIIEINEFSYNNLQK